MTMWSVPPARIGARRAGYQRGMKRLILLVPLTLASLVLAGCGGAGDGAGDGAADGAGNGGGSSTQPIDATAAAKHFLTTYVTGDGAVVRKDAQGDVVSEGQAYGMLIAEIAGNDSMVPTIWSWTRMHLQRPDKLLSWHADASGKVLDQAPASDADVLAAYALLRYDGSQATTLHAAGKELASAVLEHESTDAGNGPVPVAGTWAVGQSPPQVDPSYWMPGVFAQLADLTGDHRWSQAADTSVALVERSSRDQLPPDWATLAGDRYAPSGGGSSSTPQYGADAQRLPLWFGYGCSKGASQVAASWWRLLAANPGAQVRGLDGKAWNAQPSVLALLGEAAAADAAGESTKAGDLRRQAVDLAKQSPTYYGDAWLALSAALSNGSLAC